MNVSVPRAFDQVETWVFDLDNTLYPHHLNLWHQVDERIREYVASYLKVAREDAFRNPMQLYGRLAALQSDLAENGADFAPTTQQVAVHDVLVQRLADASARFAELMTKTVPDFTAELRKTPLRDVIGSGP